MGVELNIREKSGVTIVGVTGKLTLGEGVGELRHRLTAMGVEGHNKIVLDLAGVSQLDSSGIGVLVASFASISNQGGTLKLLNITSRVKDLLLLTKLSTVFEVYEDEAAVLGSFNRTPAETSTARG